MTDSKENYKFDLGVKGLIHFGERMAKGKLKDPQGLGF